MELLQSKSGQYVKKLWLRLYADHYLFHQTREKMKITITKTILKH